MFYLIICHRCANKKLLINPFEVKNDMDQDISKITDALYDYRDKFNKNNPEYEFNIFYEFNSLLDDRIDLLTRNGIMGLILVLLFLGLFLNLK